MAYPQNLQESYMFKNVTAAESNGAKYQIKGEMYNGDHD